MQRHDTVVQAVRAMLDETDTRAEFAVALARELEWSFADNEGECIRRCRQYFNSQTYRHLPAVALRVAIRVSGVDYVTPILQREAIKAEDRLRAVDPPKPGIRPVRHSQRHSQRYKQAI